MPATKYPAEQGLLHTCALFGGGQRWQIVQPFICTTALSMVASAKEVCDWFEANALPKLRLCLAADCEIIGQGCEDMILGHALPYRVNYATGTYPGSVTGRSYSQQVSILIAYTSALQVTEQLKVKTGKSFIGPPPESKCDQQVLDAAFVAGPVADYADEITNGFVGGVSTKQYYRGLSKQAVGIDVYGVDFRSIRQTVFTQRRRLTPTF